MCWCVRVLFCILANEKANEIFEWVQCKCFHYAVCRHAKSSVWWLMLMLMEHLFYNNQRSQFFGNTFTYIHNIIQRLSIFWLHSIFILAISIHQHSHYNAKCNKIGWHATHFVKSRAIRQGNFLMTWKRAFHVMEIVIRLMGFYFIKTISGSFPLFSFQIFRFDFLYFFLFFFRFCPSCWIILTLSFRIY